MHLFVFGVPDKTKEKLEKTKSSFLAADDRLVIAKQHAVVGDYLAEKIPALCVAEQENIAENVVAAISGAPTAELRSYRTSYPGIFFLSLPVDGGSTIVKIVRAELTRVRRILRAIAKEIQERDSRTPLLLPLRNFQCPDIHKTIAAIQELRCVDTDYVRPVRKLVEALEFSGCRSHRDGKRTYFQNRAAIRFYGPNKSRGRHATPTMVPPHNAFCLINGWFRIGTRYDIRFHYDCSHAHGNISGMFWDCHSASLVVRNKKYLNIAPNDHIRG